ncbi:HAD-IA family hydrolase [Candidatus Riflebacteria bacterium]
MLSFSTVMKTQLQNIVFDIGNVLVFFDHKIACEKLSHFCNEKPLNIYRRMYNSKVMLDFEVGLIDETTLFLIISKDLNLKISFQQFKLFFNEVFTLNQEMLSFLIENKMFFHYWIISNTNSFHFNYLKGQFPDLIKHFSGFTLSYIEGCKKPETEIFKRFIKASGFKKTECIFFDDLIVNVKGAQKAGLNASQYLDQKQFLNTIKSFFKKPNST